MLRRTRHCLFPGLAPPRSRPASARLVAGRHLPPSTGRTGPAPLGIAQMPVRQSQPSLSRAPCRAAHPYDLYSLRSRRPRCRGLIRTLAHLHTLAGVESVLGCQVAALTCTEGTHTERSFAARQVHRSKQRASATHAPAVVGEPEPRKPTVGTFPDCCALTASGHAAAVPP